MGAERERVVNGRWSERYPNGPGGNLDPLYHQCQRIAGNPIETTLPATPEAAAWEGHRYGGQALKPALEPIIVAQKPYVGRPVDSIVETGAGALWVDGGRVATGDSWAKQDGESGAGFKTGKFLGVNGIGEPTQPNGFRQSTAGRWPPNFVLQHSPECERVGERRVKGHVRGNQTFGELQSDGWGTRTIDNGSGYADADGLETVADWRCVPECPVRRLGEQSGERASGRPTNGSEPTTNGIYGAYPSRSTNGGGDTGTAARFFPNISWELNVAESADPVMRLRDDLPPDVRAAVLAELGCVADE